MEKILYKANNLGKISWWRIVTSEGRYTVSWGLDHRSMGTTENLITIKCPNPEVVARRLIRNKLKRENYYEVPSNERKFEPMLAQNFSPSIIKSWNKIAIQPKLDGIRCIAGNGEMRTRKGVTINSLPHIKKTLELLPPGTLLDGELYRHGWSIQKIQSVVMKELPTKESEEIEFWVFDIVEDIPFFCRDGKLNLMEDFFDLPGIRRVPTHKYPTIPSKTIINSYLKEYEKEGFEGIILRDGEAHYKEGERSSSLLKMKRKLDMEVKIVDVVEKKDRCGIFVCEFEGKLFEVTPAWTKERKRWLLKNKEKFLGKLLNIEYLGMSEDGIPLKAIGKYTRSPEC